MANPELLWPQAAAELRSAWTAEGGRPYASEAEQRWIALKGPLIFLKSNSIASENSRKINRSETIQDEVSS